MKKIILFGASSMGKTAYKKLHDEYKIVYYVDNDNKKWGNKLCDIEIISPARLLSLKDNNEVVITSQYDVAIANQLIEMGIKKFGVFNGDLNKIDFFDYSKIDSINKKNNKIALIMSNNSGSNTYALYKMVPSEINKKYEIVLINENSKDNNYYLDLFESRLVAHTHSNYFSDEQLNIQLWHGFPLKTLSFMSKFPNSVKIQNNLHWNKLDAIVSYSQTYSTFINACYGVNGDKYFITGIPRNDLMIKADGKGQLSKLLNISLETKKVIFYMPTFRESIYGLKSGDKYNFNILDVKDFDISEFDAFLETLGLVLVLKFHPFHAVQAIDHIKRKRLKNFYALEDKELMEINLDLYEVINAADLLITDYSSIYFDYLLLDRPIIFTPIDLEKYKNNTGFLAEPYDFWAPGPKCYTFEQLTEEILKCLNDNGYYQKERQTICNIVHHYKDANSSERVWKLIDELMENS